MSSPKPGQPRASDVVGPDVPTIVAVMRETVDARPVRYTMDQLRAFVHDRMANRPRDRPAADITVGDCRTWARQFIEYRYNNDRDWDSDVDEFHRRRTADTMRNRFE